MAAHTIRPKLLGPESGPRELPIAGRDVSVIGFSRYSPYVRIQFWPQGDNEPSYMLSLDGPCEIMTSTGAQRLEPEARPAAGILVLIDKTVARAIASTDGGLVVDFVDDGRLSVPFDAYEAWQFNGDDGSLLVSVAGGGLAIWTPPAE